MCEYDSIARDKGYFIMFLARLAVCAGGNMWMEKFSQVPALH